MLNWFKRKKEAPKEICLPKIFMDNGIEFSYQHSIEISTIPVKSKHTISDIRKLIEMCDENGLKELTSKNIVTDSAKVYVLIGSNEQEKMLIAILDFEATTKEPQLISYTKFGAGSQANKEMGLAS